MSLTMTYLMRFNPEMFFQLAQLAEKDGRSIASYIRKVLTDHLSNVMITPAQKNSASDKDIS